MDKKKKQSKKTAKSSGRGGHGTSGRKIIRSVKDIPSDSKIVDLDSKEIGFGSSYDDQVVLISTETKGGASSVWIVGTYPFVNDSTKLFGLKAKLKDGFEHIEVALAEKETIKVIREREKFQQASREEWRETDVNDFLNKMCHDAIAIGVSDVHLEVRPLVSKIRWRRNGYLEFYKPEISTDFVARLIHAAYDVEASEDGKQTSFRDSEPMEANIPRTIDGEDVNLRFQSVPVYPSGYDVTLRILIVGTEDDTSHTELWRGGYSKDQVNQLKDMASHPIGATIFSGSTGSGKSTTLKNLMLWIDKDREGKSKLFTIEDPPEFRIAPASQIPIKKSDDPAISPFDAPLKAVLRSDPNVIMVGEIRDEVTASGMKRATQTGHQVLTTLHTPSAIGCINRLSDLGVDDNTMGSKDFIVGLIYQALLPVVCKDCSRMFSEQMESGNVSEKEQSIWDKLISLIGPDAMKRVRVKGDGCETCMGSGITGRTVCAEIVQPDMLMLRYLSSGDVFSADKHWRLKSDRNPLSENMEGKTVLDHAIYKIAQGILSPFDVDKLLDSLDTSAKKMEELLSLDENEKKRHKLTADISPSKSHQEDTEESVGVEGGNTQHSQEASRESPEETLEKGSGSSPMKKQRYSWEVGL